MIELKDICVNYGNNVVYDKFSCVFPQGVNVILGKSGCGKTTLLNVVANLVPHGGQVLASEVAMVFQAPSLAPTTVFNNVVAVLPKRFDRQVVLDVLADAQIEHKANHLATTLSGGEQQRVALARAFVANRNALLLDEPFNSLDYGTKKQLYSTLTALLAKREKTVLFVTHDVDDAIALADRIYLLQGNPATISLASQLNTPRELRNDNGAEWQQLRNELHVLLQ